MTPHGPAAHARIRPARVADAERLAAIHVRSWRAAYAGVLPEAYLATLQPASLTQRWRHWVSRTQATSSTALWVLERAGEVVGYSESGPCAGDRSLVGFSAEVFTLYLEPACVGLGLGRALLEHGLDALAHRGFFWCVVWVLRENRRGRAFYERAGMRPDGEERLDRVAGEQVAVVRYARALNPALDFAALRASWV